jgi:hypothetical protein
VAPVASIVALGIGNSVQGSEASAEWVVPEVQHYVPILA